MSDGPTILYVFIRYPALSQQFLARELIGLKTNGLRLTIQSLTPAKKNELGAAVPDVPVNHFHWWEPVKLLVALPRELFRDRQLFRDGWRLFRQTKFRSAENFFDTLWAVIVALVRAPHYRQGDVRMVHGVWATGPATTAAVLGRLLGVPFSFGAQAWDLYRHGGDAFLPVKLRAAAFVHTTTNANDKHLRTLAGNDAVNIVLARRGLAELPVLPTRERHGGPVRLLSVGRLVAKKGHAHQLAACARLGVPLELRIIGEGPLREELTATIARLGLKGVRLEGAQKPAEVAAAYRWADVFWHTGVVDPQGDRDGLPNVVPEAMAHGLPVISSRMPGVDEAVEHEVTGLLVDVADAEALAAAVRRLAEDAALRERLGANGRRWVEENFVAAENTALMASAYRQAMKI
jgi:glycosyltransferase involved in cell wall biosynthesis